jgi:hypothetical protein
MPLATSQHRSGREESTAFSASLLPVWRRPRFYLLTSRTSVLLIPRLSHVRSYYGLVMSVTSQINFSDVTVRAATVCLCAHQAAAVQHADACLAKQYRLTAGV